MKYAFVIPPARSAIQGARTETANWRPTGGEWQGYVGPRNAVATPAAAPAGWARRGVNGRGRWALATRAAVGLPEAGRVLPDHDGRRRGLHADLDALTAASP